MARGILKWTEEKIREKENAGHGRGEGADYIPWIQATDFSSLGRSRRVAGIKTNRTHHLLSDVEYNLFLCLEWTRYVTDIREQYPLDRTLTQTVARRLGIRHPCYPQTSIPTVMTVDFLVTRIHQGKQILEAFNAKTIDEAEKKNSIVKLELQRACLEELGIAHHLVFDKSIPEQKVKNIAWIRSSIMYRKEVEPYPGHWDGLCSAMSFDLPKFSASELTLTQYCQNFDAKHGIERGTGLRVACMLMHKRLLTADLTHPSLHAARLSEFNVTAAPQRLHIVGG